MCSSCASSFILLTHLCVHKLYLIWHACFIGISAKATDAYEGARRKVASFVNAADSREIVFTRNATEAINLVAYSWGMSNIKQGDEVSPLFLTCRYIMFYILFYLLLMFLTIYMIHLTAKIVLLSRFSLSMSIYVKKYLFLIPLLFVFFKPNFVK